MLPKITIITVCFNSEKYIETTIQSVINQTYKNKEYIIIDGKSIDNTINIIKKYETNITYWISEKDEGMYNAINKGLNKSSGDYICILNSDDYFCDFDCLERFVSLFKDSDKYIGYYGNIFLLKKEHLRLRRTLQVTKDILISSKHATFIPHPSLFVSKKSLELGIMYNYAYKYAGDFDYIIRLLDNGKLKYINESTTVFRIHAESITSSGKLDSERCEILRKHTITNQYYFAQSISYFFYWGIYLLKNIKL